MATRAQIKEYGLEDDARTLLGAVRILRRRGYSSTARAVAVVANKVDAELAEHRRAEGARSDG